MAGTPEEGQQSIGLDASVQSAFTLTLRLYTNALGTLSETSVLADVTEATGANQPGYAAVTLTNANFSVDADGTVTYSPNPLFTATGTWTAVNGAYIEDGTRLRWYDDFSAGRAPVLGEAIRVDFTTEV